MEIINKPPIDDEQIKYKITCRSECGYLNDNFMTCLKQKAVQDNVPKMTCNVEKILWFMTECPSKLAKYNDPTQLRQIFIEEKQNELTPKKLQILKK